MHHIVLPIANQDFLFTAEKIVYWENEKTIIVSDIHLGKTTHFRKAGLAVPHSMFKEDLHRLFYSIQYFKPQKVIIVGDLFHSNHNKEHELFFKWRNDFPTIEFALVVGNHDIYTAQLYTDSKIQLVNEKLVISNIAFIHDPAMESTATFTFYGHLHPAVLIKGLGRQTLRVPCYHITKNYCILPAFGAFTGTATIKPNKKDTILAVVEKEIIQL